MIRNYGFDLKSQTALPHVPLFIEECFRHQRFTRAAGTFAGHLRGPLHQELSPRQHVMQHRHHIRRNSEVEEIGLGFGPLLKEIQVRFEFAALNRRRPRRRLVMVHLDISIHDFQLFLASFAHERQVDDHFPEGRGPQAPCIGNEKAFQDTQSGQGEGGGM